MAARREVDQRQTGEGGLAPRGCVPKRGCCRTKMRIRQVSSMSPLNSDANWSPDLLRLNPNRVPRLQGHTRSGRRISSIPGRFIAGPIDVGWVCQAAQLGVTALLVGLALWHLKGLRHADTFIVSNIMLEGWGIRPDAKSRALHKLEKAV